jgi:subtilisin family serine protease
LENAVLDLDLFPSLPREFTARFSLLDSPDPLFDAFASEPPQRPSALPSARGGRSPKSRATSIFDAQDRAQCGFPARALPRRKQHSGLSALLILLAWSALASACGKAPTGPIAPDAVLVQLRGNSALPEWSAPEAGSEAIVPLAAIGPDDEAPLLRIPVPADNEAATFAAALARDPAVAFAEPITLAQPLAGGRVPNDPRFKDLWGLAEINAPAAWGVSVGDRSVVVAVIDDGVALDHPDLRDNLWTNREELAGNGLDDDSDGIVDDLHGASFINGVSTGDPNPVVQAGSSWHGTHVAGIIGAVGDNRAGVVGVNWKSALMAVRALTPSGGRSDDLVQAIDYASAHGARVINASWGTDRPSAAIAQAIARAGSRGALFVGGAGNDGAAAPRFPASLAASNLLSVGALDVDGHLASFSNRGALLAAPGVGILSTTAPGNYERYDGTSMATGFVSGLAALLFAAHPGATVAQVRDALLSSAIATDYTQNGRIDASRALAALSGSEPTGSLVLSRSTLQFTASASSGPHAQSISIRSQTGEVLALSATSSAAWAMPSRTHYTTPARVSIRVDPTGLPPGDHLARLSFVNDAGAGVDLDVALHIGRAPAPSAVGAHCSFQQDGALHVERGALCTLVPPGLAEGASVPQLRWTVPARAPIASTRLTALYPHVGEFALHLSDADDDSTIRVIVE